VFAGVYVGLRPTLVWGGPPALAGERKLHTDDLRGVLLIYERSMVRRIRGQKEEQILRGKDRKKGKGNGKSNDKSQYRGLSTAHHKNKSVMLRSR
jgi:hypothetical protein